MMRRLMLACTLLFFILLGYTQICKTIDVPNAGDLRLLLTPIETFTVTNLTVTGNLNAKDFKFIRDVMIGLELLDVSAVNIQSYDGNEGIMQINETTFFDENKLLSGQSTEFINWYNAKYNPDLNQQQPEAFDEYSRPSKYTTTVDNITVTTYPTYQCQCAQSWARSNFRIVVEGVAYITYPANELPKFSFYPLTNNNFAHPDASSPSIGKISLKTIILPNSISSIRSCAFAGCTGLSTITISNSVSSIGDSALASCTGLSSITIPASVSIIKSSAFNSCSELKTIYSLNPLPPNLGPYCFDLAPSSVPFNFHLGGIRNVTDIFVPSNDAVINYQASSAWYTYFPGSIIKMDLSTNTNVLRPNSLKVYGSHSEIMVEGLVKGETVSLFNLNGVLLKSKLSLENYVSFPVQHHGVYIVKAAEQRVKVVI